jgi:hypothetical protein
MLGIPSDAGGQYCLVDLKRLPGELCMFAPSQPLDDR